MFIKQTYKQKNIGIAIPFSAGYFSQLAGGSISHFNFVF